jgi:hypothetical protein
LATESTAQRVNNLRKGGERQRNEKEEKKMENGRTLKGKNKNERKR